MEALETLVHDLLVFVETHKAAAAPVVFVLAFGESVALLSLLFPATVILFGIGALVGAGALDFWSLWIAAACGAALGDWISYWLGARYGHSVFKLWPMNRHPDLLQRLVAIETVDASALTDHQLLALAREHFGNLPHRRDLAAPGQELRPG
jgi:membrane protein DedA with SNARE-associated domain